MANTRLGLALLLKASNQLFVLVKKNHTFTKFG